jgi:dTDP-4-dehydrorhamnose reductase
MVEGFEPDVIVHSAIPNDYDVMYADRHATWAGYVGATRNLVDAANAAGAKIILVSTDWVFDGTQGPADETTPPNPVNLYGVMKMASELVLAERADDGAVARVSGVNGVHWARPTTIRAQDPGYGYFVGSIVDALRAGQRFLVWEDDRINMRATPSLATECAEMMWRIATLDRTGIFHCCGADSVTRRELAFAACDIFELDAELLDFGPPDADVMAGAPIPRDTSLDATATAAALDYELPSLTELLTKFRDHLDQGVLS